MSNDVKRFKTGFKSIDKIDKEDSGLTTGSMICINTFDRSDELLGIAKKLAIDILLHVYKETGTKVITEVNNDILNNETKKILFDTSNLLAECKIKQAREYNVYISALYANISRTNSVAVVIHSNDGACKATTQYQCKYIIDINKSAISNDIYKVRALSKTGNMIKGHIFYLYFDSKKNILEDVVEEIS